MRVDEWIQTCWAEAASRGDGRRQRLFRQDHEGWAIREEDPHQALATYEAAAREARLLGEPWWELYFEDWQVNALLFWLSDYRRGLDRAVANMLKVRRPAFEQCPMRHSVEFNLVDSYIGVDPLGYEPLIEQSLTYLERDCALEGQEVYRLFKSRCEFEVLRGRAESSRDWALRLLRYAEDDVEGYHADFHSGFAYSRLCTVAAAAQAWDELETWARAGEEVSRSSRCQEATCEFLLWQAVVARRVGREEEARRLHRRSTGRMKRLSIKADWAHHQAAVTFHELGGDPDRALRVRRRELQGLGDSGRLADEARCRLELCRLLLRLGRPWQEEAARLREAAGRLRIPGPYLRELDGLGPGA